MYYAIQVEPESQEWAFEIDILTDEYAVNDFAIFGNRDFRGYKPERIEKIIDMYERGYIEQALFEPSDAWNPYDIWKNSTEAMNDICPKDNGKSWSSKEIAFVRDSIKSVTNRARSYHNDEDVIADIMTVITGRKWERTTIRGCVQGDWNEMIYDTERISKDYADIIETAYFNTCDEWMIVEKDLPDGLTVDEVREEYASGNGFVAYTYHYNRQREDIADMLGVKPEQVALYACTGYTRTATYELIA